MAAKVEKLPPRARAFLAPASLLPAAVFLGMADPDAAPVPPVAATILAGTAIAAVHRAEAAARVGAIAAPVPMPEGLAAVRTARADRP